MAGQKISKRAFIRLSLLSGIGAGIVYIRHRTADFGTMNFLRWSIRGGLNTIAPPAIVALEGNLTYDMDLLAILEDLWKISNMPSVRGKKIFIKPNLLDLIENKSATTAPEVLAAVIDLLLKLGAGSVQVGEGSALRRDTYANVKSGGYSQVLAERGVEFIDLNYDELTSVKVRDGWIRDTDKIWLPRSVVEADFILSLPKLKTHHWAGVTLSIKNLLGVIPGSKYGWPKNIVHINGLNTSILGLYQSLPPVLSIVDGIVGMEGNGPIHGEAVYHGIMVMGDDPVAVDITCTQLMGFSVDSIPHLAAAAWTGMGQSKKIEVRGASIDQLKRQYKAPPKIQT